MIVIAGELQAAMLVEFYTLPVEEEESPVVWDE